MNVKTLSGILFISTLIFSCSKTDSKNKDEDRYSVNVYVAGSEYNGSFYNAKYWKNGNETLISDGSASRIAYGIAADENDLHIAGLSRSGYKTVALYWKNNVAEVLNSPDIPFSAAHSIAINNNDIYIAGYGRYEDGTHQAYYWKNGERIDLTTKNEFAQTYSMSINNNDVYISGYEVDVTRGIPYIPIPTYWKNGESVHLTNGSNSGKCYYVHVAGNEVYAAGSVDFDYTPCYWRNGIQVMLNISGRGQEEAKFITKTGEDIYIVGYGTTEHNKTFIKYWKNGTSVHITDGSTDALPTSILVYDNDLYIAGYEGGKAKYWKNGIEVQLSGTLSNEYANSIFIAEQKID